MNTHFDTRTARTARIAGSLVASALITFTGLHLIANYALPGNPQADSVKLATVAASAPVR